MKKLLLFSLFAFSILGLNLSTLAQDSKNFSVSGFTKLDLGSAFKINVVPGNQFKVVAEGRTEDLNDLEAIVSGQVLKIKYKNDLWRSNNRKEVTVSIVMPILNGLDLSGACKANIAKFPKSSQFTLQLSGASQLLIELVSKDIDLDISGASKATLIGNGDHLKIDLSGAASLNCTDFAAQSVNIEASGASNAKIIAHTSLKADASGASSIKYSGNVKEVKSNTSGASSIKRQ